MKMRGKSKSGAAKEAALERLRAIRNSGQKKKRISYDIKLEKTIYDTLDEDEYNTIVAHRRDELSDFIVGDDGEEEEEDWTETAFAVSDDDDDHDDGGKRQKEERKPRRDNEAALSVAASGTKNLGSMFTSLAFSRKGRIEDGSSDRVVEDVLAEFAPDESDRERERIKRRSFSQFKRSNVIVEKRDLGSYEAEAKVMAKEGDNLEREEVQVERKEEEEGKYKFVLNAKIKEEKAGQAFRASSELEALGKTADCGSLNETDTEKVGGSDGLESSEFVVEEDGSLPFYMIDAYEESGNAKPGTVYLFGKVSVWLRRL